MTLADRDRPLAPRGLRAGATMAAYVRDHGIVPDLVVCSPSVRTRETLELVAAGFPPERQPRVEFDARVYGASGDGLLAILREIPDETGSTMLIGHQPAIQDLALALAGTGPGTGRLKGKFPTAALATFEVKGRWSGLGPDSSTFAGLVKPREIEGAGG